MRLPRCRRINVGDDPAPLLARGWREIEQLVTYEREPVELNDIPSVEVADLWHYSVIRSMAFVGFSEDRLHKDPEVSDDDADRFKLECVDRAIKDKLPILISGEPTPLGFLIFRPEKKVSTLEMMTVVPGARRNGAGKRLVAGWLSASRGSDICRAGTQAHNEAACRMYESLGFHEVKRERTFHR